MARRKKTSPLEDVLDLLAMLPWWACVMLAAVSYLLLHRLAAPIQASDLQGQGGAMVSAMMQKAVIHGMATAGQYIVPLLCLAAAGLSALRRKQRQSLLADVAQAPNAAALDGMSWREFELLVGEAYRLQGYHVAETGLGGPDGGVDLILRKDGRRTLVQCKQWRRRQVPVNVVREMHGLLAHYNADAVRIAAIGGFTRDAARFAADKPITLIDGPTLLALVHSVQSHARPTAPAQPAATLHRIAPAFAAAVPHTAATPDCPRCGTAMVERTNRRAASIFWGCTAFPACRGTR